MNSRTPAFVHLDGRIVAAARARVSVFDRGLLYSDGVFETVAAYGGRPFALSEHLVRLKASAAFLGIRVPRRPWRHDLGVLLRRNRLLETPAWVRLMVTRGAGTPGLLPPSGLHPTVLVIAGPAGATIERMRHRGIRVVLLPFARRGFLAEHKTLSYVPGVLGKVFAARHSAFEGLFVDADGKITEGTTSNVFIFRRGALVTPPAVGILPGITRRLVMQAAVAEGLRVREDALTADDLIDANEAFITSSVAEVLPITSVHARKIGSGRVGAVTRRMQQLYRQLVDQLLA